MKFTRKIFVALLVVLTLLMSLAVLPASAAEQPETLYLTPNANWKQSNARFAAYFFGNGETWVSMTDSNGDGIYEVAVPADKVYPNVIFCRMNPGAAANIWDNKWNQTEDLAIPTSGANHYTVKEGTWDSGGGTWSTFGSTCLHTNLGEEATCTTPQICLDCKDPVVSALGHAFNASHLCTRCNEQATFTVAGSGAHMGTDWDTGNTANDMTYADGTYTKVYTNVTAGSYEFKVVRDHSWGTSYPSNNKSYTVATDGSTVTITLKGTTVNVVVDAPHVHSYFYPCDPVCQECYEFSNPDAAHNVVHVEAVAATCYENGNIEYWYCSYCGATWADEAQTQVTNQMNVVVPAAHGEAKHVAAVAPTCYENGNIEYWYCEACGQAWLDEACTRNTNLLAVVLPTIDHSYVDGACSACGAADPDYEAPGEETEHTFSSDLVAVPGADKDVLAEGTKFANDFFTIVGKVTVRWSESKGVYAVELDKKSNGGIEFTVDGTSSIVVSFASTGGSNLSLIGLVDASGNAVAPTEGVEEVTGTSFITVTYTVGAGTYKVVNPSTERNTRVNSVVVAPAEEQPHVNTLVVGDTNKIVVSGNTLNDANLPIEWVAFVADEKAHYEFIGDTGVLAFIFDSSFNLLCGGTGKADLEAGTYLICLGNGAVGEFNVAVTKSEIVVPEHKNALVVGDNKFIVTATEIAAYAEYIYFTAAEDGKYTFTASEGSNIVIFVYTDSIESLDWALTNPYVTNNGTGSNSVEANLKAGTYMIVVNYYYGGVVEGEYNINVAQGEYEEGGNDVVVKNSIALGDNTYVLSETLKNIGYEFLLFTAEKDGIYTFSGCSPLTVFLFHTTPYVEGEALDANAPYVWNVGLDAFLTDSFEVELKAGIYWVGFRYDGDKNITEVPVGEYEIEVTYAEKTEDVEPPIEDNPPVDDDPTEEPELNFFEKIWQAILNFFKSIGEFFSNLFSGNKE